MLNLCMGKRSEKSSARIAAVHLRELPLECVFGDAPEVLDEEGVPLPMLCAVREERRGIPVLAAISKEAYCQGVRVGMTESEALARCADLVVRDREPAWELERLARVAEVLFTYGPHVEVCPPNLLFVEVGGSRGALAPVLGLEADAFHWEASLAKSLQESLAEVGHQVSVAVTSDPDSARTIVQELSRPLSLPKTPASRRSRKKVAPAPPPEPDHNYIAVVPAEQTQRYISNLSVDSLCWTDLREDPEGKLLRALYGAKDALHALGVRAVYQMNRLPTSEMVSRFDEAGVLLCSRATAKEVRPLRGFKPPEKWEESYELAQVCEDLEPILFVLKRLFARLESRLEARGKAVSYLRLVFEIEPHMNTRIEADEQRARSSKRQHELHLHLARPSRSAELMLDLARERLGQALPGAVWSVRVHGENPEAHPGGQLDLFTRQTQRLEAAGELVSRLQAALGEQAVFSPNVANTHRPESAWSLAPFAIEQALAEPVTEKPQIREMASEIVLKEQEAALENNDLPEVDETLSVVGGALSPLQADPNQYEFSWPKPEPRRIEDEPLEALPPRPTELLSVPEPATLLREAQSGMGVLSWRGRQHVLTRIGQRELLQTEWWSSDSLERDYKIAETKDGRRLWLFQRRDGSLFVHGLFD